MDLQRVGARHHRAAAGGGGRRRQDPGGRQHQRRRAVDRAAHCGRSGLRLIVHRVDRRGHRPGRLLLVEPVGADRGRRRDRARGAPGQDRHASGCERRDRRHRGAGALDDRGRRRDRDVAAGDRRAVARAAGPRAARPAGVVDSAAQGSVGTPISVPPPSGTADALGPALLSALSTASRCIAPRQRATRPSGSRSATAISCPEPMPVAATIRTRWSSSGSSTSTAAIGSAAVGETASRRPPSSTTSTRAQRLAKAPSNERTRRSSSSRPRAIRRAPRR